MESTLKALYRPGAKVAISTFHRSTEKFPAILHLVQPVVLDIRSLATCPGGAKETEWGHRAKGKYLFYHKVWKRLKPRTFQVSEQRIFPVSTKRNARSNSNEGTGTRTLATFAARILDG